jgi:hypothetical protein
MNLIQRALHGWLSWRDRREFERSIRLTRRRITGMVPQLADIDRKEAAARARHRSTRSYAEARQKLVTDLLRGEAR